MNNMTTITKESCLLLDQQDPLASFKNHFDLPAHTLYMDGNSLGILPKTALKRAEQVISQEWGSDLIKSWNSAGWFEMPKRLGDKLGQLIGAKNGETVVTDTTSLNIFKVTSAALKIQQQQKPNRRIIISERHNFPSDLYMLEGLIKLLKQNYELRLIDDNLSLSDALDENTAVVLLSHVNYRSGYLWDMQSVTKQIQDAGALAIWDLCHSVGAVPIDLNAANADFAVGCTYKYLNAGPGAPAFVWVNAKHADNCEQPLSGWWGHNEPFKMTSSYAPANGVQRYLCGTQPIISLALVECGIDIHLAAGMSAIRQKSLALTDLFITLVEEKCAGFDLTLATPRDHNIRGSHVSFAHQEGYAIMQNLIAKDVIGDYREPSILRFGITPLYFGFVDVWNAVTILQDILTSKSWQNPEFKKRHAVT